MTKPFRALVLLFSLIALGALLAGPAEAKTPHHKKLHHAKSATASSKLVMSAQQHLVNLGYLTAHPDGRLGPHTELALKHFQRDNRLKDSGKLTKETYDTLVRVDLEKQTSVSALPNGDNAPPPAPPPSSNFYADHKDFYGHYNQQYADPMLLSSGVAGDNANGNTASVRSQSIANRFAKIDLSENDQNPMKTYTVTVNGQPLLRSEDQPSVIGVSKTYDLGDEDAIIFSTYRDFDPVCGYKHYLLIVNQGGNNVQQIENCTRGYQAIVKNGSLYVTFPEADDKRAIGSVWRYEKGSLEKL